MVRTRLIGWLWLIPLALAGIQCSSDEESVVDLDALLPLEVGNHWEYTHTLGAIEPQVADTVDSEVVIDGIRWFSTSNGSFVFPIFNGAGNLLRWDDEGRLHTLLHGVDGIAFDPAWPVQEIHSVPFGSSGPDSNRVKVWIHSKQHTEIVLGVERTDCYVLAGYYVGCVGCDWSIVLCPGIGTVRSVDGGDFGGPIIYRLASYQVASAADPGSEAPSRP